MKKIKYKILIPSTLVLVIAAVACSKSFLEKPPLGTLSPDIVANEKGVQGILIGAYSLVDGAGASGDDQTSAASNWVFVGVQVMMPTKDQTHQISPALLRLKIGYHLHLPMVP